MNLVEEATSARPFPQIPFMSELAFSSHLRDRGLSLGTSGIRSIVASGIIDELNAPTGDFHPFQIWPISQLYRSLQIDLDSGVGHFGLDPNCLQKYMDSVWSNSSKALTDFPKSDACRTFNCQILPLLLWLESHFVPVIHGSRPGLLHLANAPRLMWHRWKSTSRLEDLLDRHSISTEQIAKWRDRVLFQAYLADPSPDLYLLLRSMPIEQRQGLKGSLRLAYDLYEIAEIVRLFLEQVSNQPVTKEWGPTDSPDTPWVERIYGSQPQFGAPAFLRGCLKSGGAC